ncbi:hypothetical protein E5288_WYG017049 [Bos mutus]|uniref:Uncharacterized protein n=1 Tax=Bos mutus TaxID=72004 RepID=A0A6B0RD60_9CETA|nr:hypothetical protein [Bos mutus]
MLMPEYLSMKTGPECSYTIPDCYNWKTMNSAGLVEVPSGPWHAVLLVFWKQREIYILVSEENPSFILDENCKTFSRGGTPFVEFWSKHQNQRQETGVP